MSSSNIPYLKLRNLIILEKIHTLKLIIVIIQATINIKVQF